MAKIVIIDDSTFEADHTKKILESAGHEVFWAETGIQGLKLITTRRPDMVILDLILPDLPGIEVCRYMRQDPRIKEIPLIMLTAKGDVQHRVEGLEEGATDYIPKPFDDLEFKARVSAALREVAMRDHLKKKNVEYEELLKNLEKVSVTDPLTGLYNRRHFEDVLVLEYERFKRYRASFACMVIDVDHFKKVNDLCGHGVGDMVLKKVAQILRGEVRGIDTIARYGGDEFIAILSQVKHTDAEPVAARMIALCNQYDFSQIDGQCPPVTLSIGIASIDDPNIKTMEQLIQCADHALYLAKRSGRNGYKSATMKEMGRVLGEG